MSSSVTAVYANLSRLATRNETGLPLPDRERKPLECMMGSFR